MTVMAQKTNNMKKRLGFKMRSGNKPDMTKLAGITKADSKQADGRAKSSFFQKDEDDMYTVRGNAVYKRDHGRINFPDEDKNYQAWKLKQEQAADQKREKEVEIEERTDVRNF